MVTHEEAMFIIEAMDVTKEVLEEDLERLETYVLQQADKGLQLETILRDGCLPESVREQQYVQAVANDAFMELRYDIDEAEWPLLVDYCQECAQQNWDHPEIEEYATAEGYEEWLLKR